MVTEGGKVHAHAWNVTSAISEKKTPASRCSPEELQFENAVNSIDEFNVAQSVGFPLKDASRRRCLPNVLEHLWKLLPRLPYDIFGHVSWVMEISF